MTTLPTREALLAFIRENPGAADKRAIARAFRVKGQDRVVLKHLLRELQEAGHLKKEKGGFRDPSAIPPVSVLVVEVSEDGDLLGRLQNFEGEAPRIVIVPKAGEPALGPGDRVLAHIGAPDEEGEREARPIRRLGQGPGRVLGIFRKSDRGGRIEPVERKADKEWMVPPGETAGALDGELVEGEALSRSGFGLQRARIVVRLGDPGAPKAVSLIAVHQHGIPVEFPEAALREAAEARPVGPEGREDLRPLALVTIDPSDARDHDDAVFAEADADPANPGGHIVWVAIADVAHYVRPGSALDREGRKRGNSTYFPDRVVPMLPEELSGDLCSLHDGVDRPCLALRMVLDAEGRKRAHRFARGLMRSRASLTYEQVQAAAEGRGEGRAQELLEGVIRPLYAAYSAVKRERERRQPLDLDLPERRIVLSPEGRVTSVAFRERFDAHRLIEEFMILANVCAAETLEEKRRALLYRVHEEPSPEKVDALREVAEGCGLVLARGQVLRTAAFNRLLRDASGKDYAEMLHMSVLRTQTQAYYARQNFGHFGLNLQRYAHFTSPIRRYADLVVHRALISAHGWGPDGQGPEEEALLDETAKHISMTERRSMEAERETVDRYLAHYLADRVGTEFEGRVSGIARFGVFVKLDETGADGLVPISTLGREYFHHDPVAQTLTGEHTGRVVGMGMRCLVRLAEAVPVTGGLLFELLEADGHTAGSGGTPRSRGTPKRKLVKARVKAAGRKRTVRH